MKRKTEIKGRADIETNTSVTVVVVIPAKMSIHNPEILAEEHPLDT